MREGSGQKVYLKDYQPPEFLIDHTDLHFSFEKERVRVRNRMKLRRNPKAMHSESDLFLNGEGLNLKGLLLDGVPLAEGRYELTEGGLAIRSLPKEFGLEVRTELQPHTNTSLEGLYKSSTIYVTQNEPEGFRRITYYLDRPDVLSTFTTSIEAGRAELPALLSNGNRISVEEKADGRQVVKWHDPFPKPCYLFCLVAGQMDKIEDRFITRGGREVQLEIYTSPGRAHLCHHAMQSLKKAMAWDEQRFGREYDLDLYMIVAIDDFNGGAMENKGLNVFNSRLILADESTATDHDFESIEAVIAHEYFHNWTGNRVTLRDWFQLSLKEGLTVYRDQEFTSDMTSRGVKRIEDVKFLRSRQFAEDAGPSAHPVRPDSAMSVENFFTTTIYEKGSELIRMIERLVGLDGFRKGMDLYFERHDGEAVSTDDFVKAMEDANEIDLEQFRNWYKFAGTPRVKVATQYDSESRRLQIHFEQSCPSTPGQDEKPDFHIPLAMALLDDAGRPLDAAKEHTLFELREKSQVLEIQGLEKKPYLSILRGFSAPINLEVNYSRGELLFLAANDPDSFSRWEALQKLFIEEFRRLYESFSKNEALKVTDDFTALFAGYLQDVSDPAYTAHLLKLPHAYFVAQNLGVLLPKAAQAAKLSLGRTLSQAHRPVIEELYHRLSTESGTQKDYAQVARRLLKNQLLSMLCFDESFHPLAKAQYESAKTMTDQIGALNAISTKPQSSLRQELLDQFYERWQKDSLVLNKWFAIQSMIPVQDQLERVKELTRHPAFELTNPNKVYSLIGYFGSENHIAFHREDGSSYDFYLDKIAEIDRLNPSVAARLSQALQVKPLLPEDQRHLLSHKITQKLSSQKFSKNTLELLQKMAGS